MSSYDDALVNAAARQQQARHLDSKLQAVDAQLREMRGRVDSLRQSVAKEELDVERLERLSFASLLSKISGKADEKLSQERMEAHYTRVRLDADTTRLEELEKTHAMLRQQRASIGDPDGDHAAALGAKERALTANGGPATTELQRIAEERVTIEQRLREHEEARRAGIEAEKAIHTAAVNVDEAYRAQGWDMVSGGGLIGGLSQMKEHHKLGEAERAAAAAQRWLDKLAAESADIGIPADIALPNTPARFQFMETFFDNMFTDMMRREDLGNSARELEAVGDEVRKLVGRIDEECAVLERRRADLIEQRKRFIAEA